MPWHAMSFMTLFFQYNGLTDNQIGMLIGLRTAAGSCGGLFGGLLADCWEKGWRYHGRVCVAVFSVLLGIPFTVLLLHLPMSESYFYWATIVSCLFQMTATWTPGAVNRPVLADVVDETDRGTIFAWQSGLETFLSSAIAFPILAILSMRMGYKPSRTQIAEASAEQRAHNVDSLRDSMMPLIVVPWLICAAFYTALHWTLPRDMAGRGQKSFFNKWHETARHPSVSVRARA